MKKKLIILLLIIALLPTRVFASDSSNYKETDDQAIVYMFRGQGCSFCRAFLTYMNSISKEYGKYFKMVSFEVWNDSKNAELFEKVAKVTGEEAGGVPYIIIGEKVFGGYAESYNEDIKKAIMAQYENPSYDVMQKAGVNVGDYETKNFVETLEAEDMKYAGGEEEEEGTGTSSFAVVFWNAFFIVAATVAIIVVNNKNTEKVIAAVGKKEVKENKNK